MERVTAVRKSVPKLVSHWYDMQILGGQHSELCVGTNGAHGIQRGLAQITDLFTYRANVNMVGVGVAVPMG